VTHGDAVAHCAIVAHTAKDSISRVVAPGKQALARQALHPKSARRCLAASHIRGLEAARVRRDESISLGHERSGASDFVSNLEERRWGLGSSIATATAGATLCWRHRGVTDHGARLEPVSVACGVLVAGLVEAARFGDGVGNNLARLLQLLGCCALGEGRNGGAVQVHSEGVAQRIGALSVGIVLLPVPSLVPVRRQPPLQVLLLKCTPRRGGVVHVGHLSVVREDGEACHPARGDRGLKSGVPGSNGFVLGFIAHVAAAPLLGNFLWVFRAEFRYQRDGGGDSVFSVNHHELEKGYAFFVDPVFACI